MAVLRKTGWFPLAAM